MPHGQAENRQTIKNPFFKDRNLEFDLLKRL
jgi:hypothetical protein